MPAEAHHEVRMRLTVSTYGNRDKVVIGMIATVTRMMVAVFGERVKLEYLDDDHGAVPIVHDPSLKVSSMRLVHGDRIVSVGDR